MEIMCVSALRSMTHAQKAVKILNENGVTAKVVSLDGRKTKHGCAFGVSYPCAYRTRAVKLLENNGLGYGELVDER